MKPEDPGFDMQLSGRDSGGEAAAPREPRSAGAPDGWLALPAESRHTWIERYLAAELATLCGQPITALGPTRPLTAFGLDSIGAIELQHAIETRLGVAIGLSDILEGPTIGHMAERIAAQALAASLTREDEV